MADEERHPWEQPTAVEVAREFILEAVGEGPVITVELQKRARDRGISPASLGRAKRELKVAGKILVRRRGARSNPYTVELAPQG